MSSQEKNSKIDFLKTALTLFAIAALVAVLLALANYFTSPIIERSAQERLNDSLKVLMSDAERFDVVTDELSLVDFAAPVLAAYQGIDLDNESVGYCIQVAPRGYSSAIEMMVAVDQEGAISGVQILSISETPGVGMKVQSDEAFQQSALGHSDTINIVKNAPVGPNDVQVISGATVSSSAYLNGVNTALDVVEFLRREAAES